MKKLTLTLLALLALTLPGCNIDAIETQQAKAEMDYKITLLFEVDGVKVYRFYDRGEYVYFTNVTGSTEYSPYRYDPSTKASTPVKIQSLNNNIDPGH